MQDGKPASMQAKIKLESSLYKAACMLVRYFQVIGLTFHRGSAEANTNQPGRE